jgi:hypothetical protein
MLVTVLYRNDGEPPVTGSSSFTDVAAGKWYTDAIQWASANGIVTGYEDNLFKGDEDISREQIASILYRFALYKKQDVSQGAELSGYADSAQVSDWALPGLKWAVAKGIINGRSENVLAAKEKVNRAEVATMIYRYLEPGSVTQLPVNQPEQVIQTETGNDTLSEEYQNLRSEGLDEFSNSRSVDVTMAKIDGIAKTLDPVRDRAKLYRLLDIKANIYANVRLHQQSIDASIASLEYADEYDYFSAYFSISDMYYNLGDKGKQLEYLKLTYDAKDHVAEDGYSDKPSIKATIDRLESQLSATNY